MADDRLKKDYDLVENLGDLIRAREERESAISDDVDSMEDFDNSKLPVDANTELTWPHTHGKSDEDGKLGLNVDLMDTPDRSEVGFGWQDSAEEMLSTDPEPDEGMGADSTVGGLGHLDATELSGRIPSVEPDAELDTAATEEEEELFGTDGGEPVCPQPGGVQLETAMDTDSDEEDFSIQDKFSGQVNHETAEYEFGLMSEPVEEESPEDIQE